MNDPVIAQIQLWGGSWAMENWAVCDGRKLPIRMYRELFTIIGNQYGGDGIHEFALPDLRSKVPMPGLSYVIRTSNASYPRRA